MDIENIETVLKKELNSVEKRLDRTQSVHSAAWIGTGLGLGLILATMTSQIPILVAMAAGGVLLNIAATQIISRKR
ncbi:MAG: hypothetical protein BBJ60_08600 [Desulfobacterales bacterium S7086C20]|nr:MAG: hypothetical protein BBJ60_08600 [Desulfobacterales bacterium S7086C20]